MVWTFSHWRDSLAALAPFHSASHSGRKKGTKILEKNIKLPALFSMGRSFLSLYLSVRLVFSIVSVLFTADAILNTRINLG